MGTQETKETINQKRLVVWVQQKVLSGVGMTEESEGTEQPNKILELHVRSWKSTYKLQRHKKNQ